MRKAQILRNKIDLHGIKHSEVFGIVDKFIQENLYEKEVEIVTGYSHRMKELVQEVLSDYNLIGEEPQFNDGTLIVKIV